LTDALLEVGCDVALALQSDARTHEEYRVHLQPLESHFSLLARLNPCQVGGYSRTADRIDELLDAIALERPDWVYIPYADMMTQAAAGRCTLYGCGQLRSVPIEGQVMRGRYAYPAASFRGRLGGMTSRWLMQHSPWRVTHLLDTWVYNNLKGSSRTTEFRLIPEPVEPLPGLDRFEARRALGIPTDGRYVATAGGLDPRKGVGLLLTAFVRANLRPDDRLLLVGKMNQPMRDLITRDYGALLSANRLVVLDRYVSDFELGCTFLSGDVLVSAQAHQIGSSGTLVRAAAANRPIIASNFGWVGWVTKKFGLGTTVDVTNAAEFAAEIENGLNSSHRYGADERRARFCKYHTVQNQKAHWLTSLSSERGIRVGDVARRIDWNSVCDP
jgi:glycosyltransferase involved in cell wall biosynthesis